MGSQFPSEGTKTPQFRFSREVDSLAPKPGRDLGTITFSSGSDSVLLRVIEGATRDAMSFRGVTTNFDRTRILNFHLRGTFVDLLEDLPYSPYDNETEIEYQDFKIEPPSNIPFFIKKAKVIYTKVASERGLDPDGALIKMTISPEAPEGHMIANVTGIKRGWCPIATVAVVAIVAVTVVTITVTKPVVEITGKVKAGPVDVDITVKTGSGPATAQLGGTTQ